MRACEQNGGAMRAKRRAGSNEKLSSSGGRSTLRIKNVVNFGRSDANEAEETRRAPSVSRALPPVGWHSTLAHEPQMTTVCACENTVVIAKQPARHAAVSGAFWRTRQMESGGGGSPGHLTSMKYEFGDCTSRLSLWLRFSDSGSGFRRSMARVCRASDHPRSSHASSSASHTTSRARDQGEGEKREMTNQHPTPPPCPRRGSERTHHGGSRLLGGVGARRGGEEWTRA